ncbi:hypothetical protein GOP47_0021167 [Adiantum capillus-veneris]|uniref:Uncharacterized protein n=1 Tax=Adiantum capillus-veneris TaxID=13818 RepID=A0A9D4UBD8_ADICA|nr:hypothetical protein GOP47_0021167 [Adiantum capillus-veneris]
MWLEVVHVLISDEPGGLPRKKKRIEPDNLSTTGKPTDFSAPCSLMFFFHALLEKEFNLEFQNLDNVSTMHQALTCIMQEYGYAPIAGRFQSSGWGRAGWYANC